VPKISAIYPKLGNLFAAVQTTAKPVRIELIDATDKFHEIVADPQITLSAFGV
jgi:hypothetical protein